jgi:hypothetical protein
MTLADDAYEHAKSQVKQRQRVYDERNYGGAMSNDERYNKLVEHLETRKQTIDPGYVPVVVAPDAFVPVRRLLDAVASDIAIGAPAIDSARQLQAVVESQAPTFSAHQLDVLQSRLGQMLEPLAGLSPISKRDAQLVGVRTVLDNTLRLVHDIAGVPNAQDRRLLIQTYVPTVRRDIAPDFAEQKAETMAEKVFEQIKRGVKSRQPSNKTREVARRQSEAKKSKHRAKKRVRLQPMPFEPVFMD